MRCTSHVLGAVPPQRLHRPKRRVIHADCVRQESAVGPRSCARPTCWPTDQLILYPWNRSCAESQHGLLAVVLPGPPLGSLCPCRFPVPDQPHQRHPRIHSSQRVSGHHDPWLLSRDKPSGDARMCVVIEHPLQPFSRSHFRQDIALCRIAAELREAGCMDDRGPTLPSPQLTSGRSTDSGLCQSANVHWWSQSCCKGFTPFVNHSSPVAGF